MNVALNPEQVEHIAGIPIEVVKYSDLHKYKNINQLFNKKKAVLLLYQIQPTYGHWCCLVKHKKSMKV